MNDGRLKLDVVETVHICDFVIVEFARKASLCYYVGRVTKERDEDGDIEVEFMKRKGGFFIKPTPSDIASVHIDNMSKRFFQSQLQGGQLIEPRVNLCSPTLILGISISAQLI